MILIHLIFLNNYKIFCLLCVVVDGNFSMLLNLNWGITKAIGEVVALLS